MREAKEKILCLGRKARAALKRAASLLKSAAESAAAKGRALRAKLLKAAGRGYGLIKPYAGRAGRFIRRHRVPAAAIGACLTLSMLMSVITVTIHRIDVFDQGVQTASYYSIQTDEASVLRKIGLVLGTGDELELSENGGVVSVYITRAFPVTIQADGGSVLVMMTGGTVAQALERAGVTKNEEDLLSHAPDTAVEAEMQITLDRVENDLVYETVSIEYETRKVKTDSLYVGETSVEESGSRGEKRNTYAVTRVNGVETARTLVSSEIIKEPADRVVLVGTKVKSSFKKTASTPAAYKKVIAMTATAYVAGGTTATGRPAQWGVVAVDPRVIPLGTRVYVETADGQYIYGTAVAADTGGAIKGNKIDICVNTSSEAYAFGRRTVNVYILD